MNIKTINIVNTISEILFSKNLITQISIFNKGSDIIFQSNSFNIKIFSDNSEYFLNECYAYNKYNVYSEKRIDKFYKILKEVL